MKKIILSAMVAFGLGSGAAFAAPAGGEVADIDFSFDGPFGTYDQSQLQRGLQVFTEVCAACHGLRQVAFRTLSDLGYSEAQIKAYAANYDVYDAELDDTRPAGPADKFPVVDGVGAPDLSMMAKARAGFSGPYGLGLNQLWYGMGGPEYITGLLEGYTGKEKEEAGTTIYQNAVFRGGWIAMGPPLEDGQVEFADGHANDVPAMAEDVSAFLMWAAEPKLPERKMFGFKGVLILLVLAVLLYLTNKKLWAPIKRRVKEEA